MVVAAAAMAAAALTPAACSGQAGPVPARSGAGPGGSAVPGGARPVLGLDVVTVGGDDEVLVALTPPEGWSLYSLDAHVLFRLGLATGAGTDSAENGDPFQLGRPLRFRTGDGRRLAPRSLRPAPRIRSTPWGASVVHEGPVLVELQRPEAWDGALEVEWALCRDDLCVPGRSTVEASPPASR